MAKNKTMFWSMFPDNTFLQPSTFGDTLFFNRCFGDRGGRCKIRLQNDVSRRGRLAKSPTSNIYICIHMQIHVSDSTEWLQSSRGKSPSYSWAHIRFAADWIVHGQAVHSNVSPTSDLLSVVGSWPHLSTTKCVIPTGYGYRYIHRV